MTPESFYDDLAAYYHFVYEDWPRSIERQGDALATIIRGRVPAARTVADVACGIGTQSLGLAARGFEVTGSDVSTGAIARAREEASSRGLAIEFRVDDMERLSTYENESADALIACDNALPHLLRDEQIAAALRRFREVLRPGGVCVISVRDYDTIDRDPRRLVPYGVREWDGRRVIVFQTWEFDGPRYRLDMYFTFDDGTAVQTRVFRTMYYAISIARLMELAREAGFIDGERIDDAFFQPLIVASRGR
jgi:SAM-dependent methyltransferase